jgi:hypothetical protein
VIYRGVEGDSDNPTFDPANSNILTVLAELSLLSCYPVGQQSIVCM